jgi:hypothetical protein
METVYLVLKGSHGMDFDRVEVSVNNPEDCAREVLAAVARERWVLSVGDRIEIQDTPE